jgi:hypothetical protein
MSARVNFFRWDGDHLRLYEPGGAIFSGSGGMYRNFLWRMWDFTKPVWRFIMLNPSKAGGAKEDFEQRGESPETEKDLIPDQTIAKLYGFTRKGGGGGFVVGNLFSYVETNSDMLALKYRMGFDVVGPENDGWLRDIITQHTVQGWGDSPLIVAWGAKVDSMKGVDKRLLEFQKLIPAGTDVRCFGRTKPSKKSAGQPCHPLMLGYNTPLVTWPYTPALIGV